MPRRQHLRAGQRQWNQQQAAHHRPAPQRQRAALDRAFDRGDQPHHRDADHRAAAAEQAVDGVVGGADINRRGCRQQVGLDAGLVGHERAGQRGDRDRRQCSRGVGTDDDLEGVERAGQWRAEGGGDGTGGTSADQDAHVVAAQAHHPAQLGAAAGAHLRIRRLQPDRGAAAVGQQGLAHWLPPHRAGAA
ncbi:hypothetical protein G6F65_019969 [Rhizopus arrhizus]|nr:hypothetical protein G6F65_019969 [Rhizopus arrhizus]